jgi:PhoPQ-activated pathogenicity-related protein
MSYSGEQTFRAAVVAAEGVRQQAKAVAFVAYGYVTANLATYQTAIADADVAYFTAVNTAYNALNETTGLNGFGGPIAGAGWTPMLASA